MMPKMVRVLTMGARHPREGGDPGHFTKGGSWIPAFAGMTFSRWILANLVVTLALVASGARPAAAQDATLPGGVQILFTPNLWLANVNSAIKTPLQGAPEVNSTVGAFQLLGHLDAVPFLGGVEIH